MLYYVVLCCLLSDEVMPMGAAAVLTHLAEAQRSLGSIHLALLHWPGGHGPHKVPDCAQRHQRISWRRCRVDT